MSRLPTRQFEVRLSWQAIGKLGEILILGNAVTPAASRWHMLRCNRISAQ
jgi:hypothetical protein